MNSFSDEREEYDCSEVMEVADEDDKVDISEEEDGEEAAEGGETAGVEEERECVKRAHSSLSASSERFLKETSGRGPNNACCSRVK